IHEQIRDRNKKIGRPAAGTAHWGWLGPPLLSVPPSGCRERCYIYKTWEAPLCGDRFRLVGACHRVQWLEPIECLDPDVVGPGGFTDPGGRPRQHLGALLRLHALPVALQLLFVGVVLGLVANVNLISLPRWIDVPQFPVLLDGRHLVCSQLAHLSYLRWSSDGVGPETSLRQKHFFL